MSRFQANMLRVTVLLLALGAMPMCSCNESMTAVTTGTVLAMAM